MNIWDILILLLLAGVVAFFWIKKSRNPSGCGGSCGSYGSCVDCKRAKSSKRK